MRVYIKRGVSIVTRRFHSIIFPGASILIITMVGRSAKLPVFITSIFLGFILMASAREFWFLVELRVLPLVEVFLAEPLPLPLPLTRRAAT